MLLYFSLRGLIVAEGLLFYVVCSLYLYEVELWVQQRLVFPLLLTETLLSRKFNSLHAVCF